MNHSSYLPAKKYFKPVNSKQILFAIQSFIQILLPGFYGIFQTLISPLYAAEAELDDVVVTASGFKQQAKKAAASITVINAKELVMRS